MEQQPHAIPLESIVHALEDLLRPLTHPPLGSYAVTQTQIWFPGSAPPAPGTMLITPLHGTDLPKIIEQLPAETSALALFGTDAHSIESDATAQAPFPVFAITDEQRVTEIISTFERLSQPDDSAELRRLTNLQRTLSQALEDANPVDELIKRLQKQVNAVCVVSDNQGRVTASTGTLPLSLFFEQVQKTEAPTQRVMVSGWEGLAVRLSAGSHDSSSPQGWLIVAARRPGFPSIADSAAAHITATLIETAQRMRVAAKAQEEAIRSAIFDESLDLNPKPDSPELASRLSALGFDFSEPLRVVVAESNHPALLSRSSQQQLQSNFTRMFEDEDLDHLSTTRGSSCIFLIQASSDTLTRLMRIYKKEVDGFVVGIGRDISSVIEVAESYADGRIATQVIRTGQFDRTVMAYEDFDFATRLFASVGLDRMTHYSQELLEPLLDRGPMLEALRTYFDLAQNTAATADALGIHHNTLRYRLAKVEELLAIDLNEPSVVASLFLAITTLDLTDSNPVKPSNAQARQLDAGEGITKAGTPVQRRRTLSSSITTSRPPKSASY